MSLRIVVPAKALARAKSRLAAVLDETGRRALGRRFLVHTLTVAASRVPPDALQVVSDGTDALECARALGAAALAQRGRGLNRALAQAREAARGDGVETLLVLASDLPFLAEADIDALVAASAEPGALAVAPDRARRGTNALALPAAADFRFRFGADSAAAHTAEARRLALRPALVDRPGLAFDVDTPADHAAFLARGGAVAEVVRRPHP